MYTKISNPMDYKVALYIRLSKEDENEGESGSVTNQRSMMLTYAKNNRLDVYNEYIDDGFSGCNFDRPAFKRMIEDIGRGKVNMVITKDLSRLGRDYILTGHYMERFFPENRVRYISILDGIDTGIESSANDITPFRAIMNDMYAKDISKKIKSVKHDKQNKGLFIGGKAVYGYKLSETEKNKIVIDEEVAPTVRQIFSYAVSGKSCREIAQILNDNKIIPPAVYADLTVTRKGPCSGLWSSERVSDMLQNQTYIGNMAQGKSKKISYKSEKSIKIPRKDWIVVENTHESIIDKDMFYKVQTLVASRKTTRMRTYNYPLKGIIHCHECGYPLAVINRPDSKGNDCLYFVCRTYQRFTKANACTCHSIKEETVNKAVFEEIGDVCKNYLDEDELLELGEKFYGEYIKREENQSEAKMMENKITTITANMDKIYMDKLNGILSDDDFTRIFNRMKEERITLEEKLTYLNKTEIKTPKQKKDKIKELVSRFLDTDVFNRELFLSLVERVELTEEKEIIICFKSRELKCKKEPLLTLSEAIPKGEKSTVSDEKVSV